MLLLQMAVVSSRVVGVSFGTRQAVINELAVGDTVYLYKEPENQFDKHAVAVKTTEGDSVGYLSRETAAAVHHRICDSGTEAKVSSVGRSPSSGLLGMCVLYTLKK